MEYALAAIGGLVLLVVLGGVAYARKSKQVGVLKTENKAMKEGASARERQDKAEAEHDRVGDLNDDARFLHDKHGGFP